MFIPGIRKIFFLFIISLFAFTAKAQIIHFIYLQTEGGQPFYVKFNNKLISSSSEGYIILPNISDGVYPLVVGFPKKEFPEENFVLTVDKKNEGFLLKNFNEKGWQLFNLQTLALTEGNSDKSAFAAAPKNNEDSFTKMLAGVVKDSSILQNHEIIVAPAVKPVDTTSAQNNTHVLPSPKTDSTLNNRIPASVSDIAIPKPLKENSSVTQILNSQDSAGVLMIYADKNDNGTDTVSVFMPKEKEQTVNNNEVNNEKPKAVMESKDSNASAAVDASQQLTITPTIIKPSKDTATSVVANIVEEKKDSAVGKPLQQNEVIKENNDSSSQSNAGKVTQEVANPSPKKQENKALNNTQDGQMVVLPKEVTVSKVNSDCKDFATTEDFLKLRKKMAAESNMDNMLKVAKKYLRLKCYSTEQIKDLSYLFLTDEGKYMFFDAAYPFASDSDQYGMLQSQFTDEYYLNRFKAMIRK